MPSGHGVPSEARDERGIRFERRHDTLGRAERSRETQDLTAAKFMALRKQTELRHAKLFNTFYPF
jgi:hypothetical protein